MSSAPNQVHSRDIDHRDDYRNGFVDALLYQQGVEYPTPDQIRAAVDVLTKFRVERSTGKRSATEQFV